MIIQAWYPLGHGDKALLEEPVFSMLRLFCAGIFRREM